MRLPALTPFPRRWSLFGLAALLVLALAALLFGPGAALSQNGPSVTGVAVSSSPASGAPTSSAILSRSRSPSARTWT